MLLSLPASHEAVMTASLAVSVAAIMVYAVLQHNSTFVVLETLRTRCEYWPQTMAKSGVVVSYGIATPQKSRSCQSATEVVVRP